jgi:16S rRNA U516 pseudouridylate synthase RsuA-like enzyme
MRKFNQDAPGVKLRGRPKKESSDKRDRKVSVNFTDAEEREVKAKAAAAGVSIAELLRICVFRLSVVGRLTDFVRELMYQGKNLNAQVKACQANAWPSTKRKAEACLDGILATLGKLKTSNSSLL